MLSFDVFSSFAVFQRLSLSLASFVVFSVFHRRLFRLSCFSMSFAVALSLFIVSRLRPSFVVFFRPFQQRASLQCRVEGIVEFMKSRSGSGWKPPTEATLVLTKKNFTAVTSKEELMIVMFYATWLAGFLIFLLI